MPTIVKTPRKEKSFFRFTGGWNLTEASAGVLQAVDVLSQYKTALGLGQTRSLTVMNMRIRAEIRKVATTDSAGNGFWDFCFGIGWLHSNVVTPGAVGADPAEPGIRATRWIHKWDQTVWNDHFTPRLGDNRYGDPLYQAETRNMAKQPSAGHDLSLIFNPQTATVANSDVFVGVIIEGMLALP